MLKILQINTAERRGGAETVASNLHDAYRNKGHASWLAVGDKRSEDPHVFEIPTLFGASGWERTWQGLEQALYSWDGKRRGLKQLHRILRTLAEPQHFLAWSQGIEDFDFPGTWRILDSCPDPPDIVHCHNLHSNYFDLRALPSLSRSVPLVLTLHDAWLLSGHCAHSFDCERWKSGCGSCPDLTIYPSVRRDATAFNWERKREIYSRSRFYAATPSQWLMRRVEMSILAPAIVDARIIPNGVDRSVFHPASREQVRSVLGIPSEARMLMFAANGIRPNVFKDFTTMRSAVALVAQRLLKEEILFVALGEDAPSERIDGAEVRFVPYEHDAREVARYYQAADVYVHAARADNFPLTVLEALACGVPVVATNVGGIPEQVVDGQTGFLVPPSDAESMARAIETLLSDDALRQSFSTQAAKDASERFDLNRQAEEYLRWYREILESWGRGTAVGFRKA